MAHRPGARWTFSSSVGCARQKATNCHSLQPKAAGIELHACDSACSREALDRTYGVQGQLSRGAGSQIQQGLC